MYVHECFCSCLGNYNFFAFEFSGFGVENVLYPELWKACAGPLVDVPKIKERVYYFPQGHMEQVSNILFLAHLYCLLWVLESSDLCTE